MRKQSICHCVGPPNLLKVLAAGPSSNNALFQFSLPPATDGVAAAAAGGLDGLNLITRKDRFGKSASQATSTQVCSYNLSGTCCLLPCCHSGRGVVQDPLSVVSYASRAAKCGTI